MIKKFFLKSIKFYQRFFSPFLGANCRFYPTCSQYFCEVVEKHGVIKGSWQGIKRIFRCHPFHPGGLDLP